MTNYDPDSFASIMRTIYHEQVARYEAANINPHPRAYQEGVKLRVKIQKAYALRSDDTSIANIAECVLLALRDGKHMIDIMELSNAKLLQSVAQFRLVESGTAPPTLGKRVFYVESGNQLYYKDFDGIERRAKIVDGQLVTEDDN